MLRFACVILSTLILISCDDRLNNQANGFSSSNQDETMKKNFSNTTGSSLQVNPRNNNLISYEKYIINESGEKSRTEWLDIDTSIAFNSINILKSNIIDDNVIRFDYFTSLPYESLILLINIDGELKDIYEIEPRFQIHLDSLESVNNFLVVELVSLSKNIADSTLYSASVYKTYCPMKNGFIKEIDVDIKKHKHSFEREKHDFFSNYYKKWFNKK